MSADTGPRGPKATAEGDSGGSVVDLADEIGRGQCPLVTHGGSGTILIEAARKAL